MIHNQNPEVYLYLGFSMLGGAGRVVYFYGWKGFKTPKVVVDAFFTALGSVIYPYLVPDVPLIQTPVLVTACEVAAATFFLNHYAIKLLKKWLGYTDSKSDEETEEKK